MDASAVGCVSQGRVSSSFCCYLLGGEARQPTILCKEADAEPRDVGSCILARRRHRADGEAAERTGEAPAGEE
jgi:hypothetical protein